MATVAALTGKVKILSDMGAGIVSNNGGTIISIISNNSGAIVANNGGGLTGKTKLHVAATAPAELVLADALVEVLDAAGKPVLDASGKPMTATTDATGTYHFAAGPPRNAVLRIKLHDGGLLHGGELSAMKTPAVTELGIDTATSLGAAYVLGKYVQGSQQALDKLPTADARHLHDDLDAARALLGRVPSYQPADLVAATEELRGKAPAVAKTLDTIRALLLGQANLGEGRQATSVAIFNPTAPLPLADGGLMVGEHDPGRLRLIAADGAISTYADVVRGKVKGNFKNVQDLAQLADGTLLVATPGTIFRVPPGGGNATIFAGNGTPQLGGEEGLAVNAAIAPGKIGVGADGTVYLAETTPSDGSLSGRLLAIGTDGILHKLPIDLGGADGGFRGLAVGPDGELDLLWKPRQHPIQLLRYRPGTGVTLVKDGVAAGDLSEPDLARGADGTLYVTDPGSKRVLAFGPDGKERVVAGAGAAVGAELVSPADLAVDAHGTLLVCDHATNLVYGLDAAGTWSLVAGADPSKPVDPNALPLNAPGTCAFQADNQLLITELASHSLKRFDGQAMQVLGGGTAGFGGDGGPVGAALFNTPTGVAVNGREILVLDYGNKRLRAVAADGTVRTLAGGPGSANRIKPGERLPATQVGVQGQALLVDHRGRIYWTVMDNQIVRLAEDGMVELVAGVAHENTPGAPGDAPIGTLLNPPGDGGPAIEALLGDPEGMAFDAHGDLVFADALAGRIRKVTGLDGDSPRVEAVAGIPTASWIGVLSGDGKVPDDTDAATATIAMPGGLAIDTAGNIYVGELGTVGLSLVTNLEGALREDATSLLPRTYARVRKITPDGHISVVAGPGGRFFPDPAAEDGLVLPFGLAIAPDGRMAILDPGTNLVRILPAGSY